MSTTSETAVANQEQCHFTYCSSFEPDLHQGDLLDKIPGLREMLEKVHPHYLKDDYQKFIVLTPSCGLVRRNGNPCNARYITLAAVRPLHLVIEREVEKYQDSFAKVAGACKTEVRSRVESFLATLLNNNDPRYFYLHKAPQFGLPNRACAFLHLSIALKTREHYEMCFAARKLSLKEVFRAKLGWLVGNIYSQVGTEDWVPRHQAENEFQKQIEDLLDSSFLWRPYKLLRAAKKTVESQGLFSRSDSDERNLLRECIEGTVLPDRRESVLERVACILDEMKLVDDPKQIKTICNRLRSDSGFSACFPK